MSLQLLLQLLCTEIRPAAVCEALNNHTTLVIIVIRENTRNARARAKIVRRQDATTTASARRAYRVCGKSAGYFSRERKAMMTEP